MPIDPDFDFLFEQPLENTFVHLPFAMFLYYCSRMVLVGFLMYFAGEFTMDLVDVALASQ